MEVLLIIALAAVSIILMRASIRITYLKDGEDDEIVIIFSTLLGLVNIKGETNVIDLIISKMQPSLKLEQEIEITRKGRLVKELEQVLGCDRMLEIGRYARHIVKKYREPIDYLKNKTTMSLLTWETVIGSGNAAITGIAAGALWNLKGLFLYIMNSHFREVRVHNINIKPDFEKAVFSTRIDCIFSFKIGHAIIAGFKSLSAKSKDGDFIE